MLIQLWPVELPLLKCQKMRHILPIQYLLVNHIVPISKPKEAMRGTLEVALKANLHPRNQHCIDEAQKAETVLSAVSYIYVYG